MVIKSKKTKTVNKEKLDALIIKHAKTNFKLIGLSKTDINYLITKKTPLELYNILNQIHDELNSKIDPEGIETLIADMIKKEQKKKK